MAQIKVAVVGTGGIARQHGRALADNVNGEIVAAVDIDRERRQQGRRGRGGQRRHLQYRHRPGWFDNNAHVLLRSHSGASAVINASWSSRIGFNGRGVLGTRGPPQDRRR